ncbi:MAG: chorismate synthase [Calditrichaeota bacterium]|nr:chorismate synthase [Calditrichota bacterium]
MRYLTAGESHGPALVGIIEGLPAGLEIDIGVVNLQLSRRQQGYGRGGRMKIEKDEAVILSGVRHGKTLGSPVAVMIKNRDWENWRESMSVEKLDDLSSVTKVTIPRPGHADLPGAGKYGHEDLRNVLERASARETAIRVAIGAIAGQLLRQFGIQIVSHVKRIGDVLSSFSLISWTSAEKNQWQGRLQDLYARVEQSPVRCFSKEVGEKMCQEIDLAKEKGESLGGEIEIGTFFLPPGLGSHVHWDRKLDGKIAGAMMSIPAIKCVEIGIGKLAGGTWGSDVHDEIFTDENGNIFRRTNRAGGLEGGMTNGEPIVVKCTMKPIPTLMRPLRSVDLETKQAVSAHKERSDVCAVPAAAVVAESVLALVLADEFCEKFGGDSIEETRRNFENYLEKLP